MGSRNQSLFFHGATPARGRRGITWLAIAAMGFGLAACATTDDEKSAPAPTGSEFDQGQVVEESTTTVSRGATLELDTVYFDFDRAVIRDDAKSVLQANANEILGSTGVITIEGHCDERGSEEYNLALGERRASATKKYLVNLGVPSDRLRTISYGEAKPAVQGHDESAWRWNRRAAFRSGS